VSQIDPYIVSPPRAFSSDPELAAWYNYTNRFLHDLWVGVTGGTGDTTVVISDISISNQNQITGISASVSSMHERIEDLEGADNSLMLLSRVSKLEADIKDLERRDNASTENSKEFNGYTVTQNQTLRDFDFVNVKNRSTVTLPQYPVKNSVIIIRNGDGSTVGINANGKTLNDETTGKLYRKGTTITIQYFIDSNEWVAR
jgi:hypothetical protein